MEVNNDTDVGLVHTECGYFVHIVIAINGCKSTIELGGIVTCTLRTSMISTSSEIKIWHKTPLTSYFPMLFKKDMLTDPIGFLKNHLPEPREFEW